MAETVSRLQNVYPYITALVDRYAATRDN